MFGTIYQLGGSSVYDNNGQTFYANGPNAGQVYSPAAPAPATPIAATPASPAPAAPTPAAPAAPLGSTALSTQLAQQAEALGVQNVPQSLLTTAGATPAQAAPLAAAVTAQPLSATPTPNPYSAAASYSGPSIVDFLNLSGQASDMASRTALAAKYGIGNYTGTADQNTQLLGILQAIAKGTNSAGVPNVAGSTLGSPTTPTPNSPLDLSKLTSSATGGPGTLDLSKILGANAGGSGSIPNSIAGIMSLYNAALPSQAGYDQTGKDLVTAMNSLGGQGADQVTAENSSGYTADEQQVQSLNLQAAQQKGQLDSFDAETQQGLAGINGQAIPTGLLSGQAAAYQKQRDLTRASMAAEMSSTIALSQAYQGNADIALKLATDSVNMKYAPIQANIDALKEQLTIAGTALSEEDKTRSSVISTLVTYQSQQLATEKATQTTLQTMGVQAASGGAPLSTVQQAIATGDPVQAAALLNQYLKGPAETTADLNGTGGGASFTTTQTNKGAADAGMSSTDFAKLPNDVQNFFINGKLTVNGKAVSAGQGLQQFISDVSGGTLAPADAKNTIDGSSLPADVKTYIDQQIDSAAPAGGGSGSGFLGTLEGWGSSALNGIKSLLGI